MKGGDYMKKKLLLSAAVVTLAGLSYFGTGYVSAQANDTTNTTLVQKIATKFGLNQTDVQAVFDEHRDEHHQQMQARFEEKLTQLVKDGKITEEQKTRIIAKFNEMKQQKETTRETMQNMTPEERKAAHDTKQEELKAWAEANGIDVNVLTDAFGPGRGMGKHMMR